MADQLYKVKDPTGAIREIRGPAGASDEEIIAQAKLLFSPARQPEQPIDPSEGGLPFRPFGMDTGMTMPQGVSRFAAGAGKAMTDIGRGAGQMIGMGPSPEEMSQIRQQDKPLMNTGAGLAGNITGGIAASAPAMLIPGANTLAGYGALGGAMGALQPTAENDSRLANTAGGAALGVALPSAISGVGKLGSMARNVVDPWLPGGIDRAVGRTANAAAGPDKAAIIQALRNPQQIVPGSPVTAGEAAAPIGRAEFSGLQEAVKGRAGTEFERIAQAQNQARADAISNFAKGKPELEAAIAARKSATDPLYAAADTATVKVDSELADILKRLPKGTLSTAEDIARIEGKPIIFGGQKSQQTTSGVLNAAGNPVVSNTPAIPPDITGRGVDLLKKAMDTYIDPTGLKSIGKAERNAILNVRSDLLDWAEKHIPEYGTARSTFRNMSGDVNQMQIGQELLGRLQPILEGSNQRAGMYANAMRDSANTVQKAGGPRYQNVEDALNPANFAVAKDVEADLARKNLHERLSKAGMERARELVGQVAPKVPAAGMFSPHYSVMRAVINRLEGKVEGKSLDKLASAMQDPQELARVMEGLSPQARSLMVKAMMEARVPMLGGTVNAAEQGANQ